MQTLIQFSVIVVLFILVRAMDLGISAALRKAYITALVYGFVAVLAAVFVIQTLFH